MKNSPWFDALLDPAGILILITAVVAGLISAWWMFLVGILFWAILVIRTLRDPSLRINQAIQNRSELSQRFQKTFNVLQKSQVSFYNSIRSSDRHTQEELMPINNSIEQLLEEVYESCKRYSVLENHRLVSNSIKSLQAELDSLLQSDQHQGVADSANIDQIKRKSLEMKIASQKNMEEKLDEFSNKLIYIQSQIDSTISEALQAQSEGESELKRVAPEIIKKVAQIRQEID